MGARREISMHKSVRERIYADADACARKNRLNPHRVRRIFLELCMSDPLSWWMHFDQAIASVGPQRALEIFSNTGIEKLWRRSELFNDLNDSLFCTLPELGQLIEAFVVYSKANKASLLKTGYSEDFFAPSLWFHSWLNFLYPTAAMSGKPFSSLRPKIGDLCPGDRKLLIAEREKLFNVKVQLLNRLAQILKKNDGSKLWGKCLTIFIDNFSANDIDLFLRVDRLTDKVRLGVNGPILLLSARITSCPQRLTLEEIVEHFPTGLSAGGLTEMLNLIGHCEKEFTIGTKARTKLSFLSLPDDFSWSSYYKNVGSPWQAQLDKALDEFYELRNQENTFWKDYVRRVNDALKDEFYEEVNVRTRIKRKYKAPYMASIKSFADFQKSHLETMGQLATLNISANISPQKPELTSKQLGDYKDYDYLCRDRLYIPGTYPRRKGNDIKLNNHKLSLGDSLFVLLLRFVVELKKGKGGWINIQTLLSDKVITDPMKYQIYHRLRAALEGSLSDNNGQQFIQNDGSKNYRISTHPDFINYDRKKLLEHPNHRIRKIAKKLP